MIDISSDRMKQWIIFRRKFRHGLNEFKRYFQVYGFRVFSGLMVGLIGILASMILTDGYRLIDGVLNQIIDEKPQLRLMQAPPLNEDWVAFLRPKIAPSQDNTGIASSDRLEAAPQGYEYIFETLSLQLMGIMVNEAGEGDALLSGKGVSLGLYRQDQPVYAQVMIDSMTSRKIVFREYDKLHEMSVSIELMDLFGYKLEGTGDLNALRGTTTNAAPPASNHQLSSEAKGLLEEIRKKPMNAFRYISLSPTTENGEQALLVGIRARKAVFDDLGIQAGDLIVSVDGHPVSEIMKSPAKLKQLTSARQINLTILRDGLRETININE